VHLGERWFYFVKQFRPKLFHNTPQDGRTFHHVMMDQALANFFQNFVVHRFMHEHVRLQAPQTYLLRLSAKKVQAAK
jgi:hypothetical protein